MPSLDLSHVIHFMLYMSTTVTVRQLRHDLKSVEEALTKGPVKVTKRGKVVWTIRAEKAAGKPAKWAPSDVTARSRAILGSKADRPINVLDFIG